VGNPETGAERTRASRSRLRMALCTRFAWSVFLRGPGDGTPITSFRFPPSPSTSSPLPLAGKACLASQPHGPAHVEGTGGLVPRRHPWPSDPWPTLHAETAADGPQGRACPATARQ
jgi:hypothetical protein